MTANEGMTVGEEADDKTAVHPNPRIEAALRHAENWADKHSENGVTATAGGMLRQLVQIVMEQSDEIVSLQKTDEAKELAAAALTDEARLNAALEQSQLDLADAISHRDSWRDARDRRNSLWLDEKVRADAAEATISASRTAWIDWLLAIHYPFDMTFDPAPPVDLRSLAITWKERDGWINVSDDDATNMVAAAVEDHGQS